MNSNINTRYVDLMCNTVKTQDHPLLYLSCLHSFLEVDDITTLTPLELRQMSSSIVFSSHMHHTLYLPKYSP